MMNDAPVVLGESSPVLFFADGLWLVSVWKPLVVLATLLVWAWVVSTIYDKDSARWYLPRRMWNIAHMIAGLASLGVIAVLPLTFFVTWPVMAGILAADLLAYFVMRNGDSRVPDSQKWSVVTAMKGISSGSKKEKVKQVKNITMVFKSPSGEVAIPQQETPEFELRVLAETIVGKMIERRAIQFDIGPANEQTYAITFMVDGVREGAEKVPPKRAIELIEFFKSSAGLDVQDRRKRQIGIVELGKTGSPLISAQVSTIGGKSGLRLTLVLDPERQVQRKIEDLGLLPSQLKDLQQIIDEKEGVVLLAMPADNGRTTTLYALVRAHDAYTSNVQTIESEKQASIEGVRQNVYDAAVDAAEFSTIVRSILRRDPDIVGVAEMPDEDTAKEIARADHPRTRTYFAMRGESALQAIDRKSVV